MNAIYSNFHVEFIFLLSHMNNNETTSQNKVVMTFTFLMIFKISLRYSRNPYLYVAHEFHNIYPSITDQPNRVEQLFSSSTGL